MSTRSKKQKKKFGPCPPRADMRSFVPALRAHLDTGLAAGTLEIFKGKINRRAVLRAIGLSDDHYYYRIFNAIFAEYDIALHKGKNAVVPIAKVELSNFPVADLYEPLRLYLEKGLAERTLVIKNGRISRTNVFRALNIRLDSYNFNQLDFIFREYDALAEQMNYMSAEVAAEVAAVKEILANPPLARGGMSISREAVIKLLGLPLNARRKLHLRVLFDAADQTLKAEYDASPYVFIVEGIAHNLSDLREALPDAFLIAIASVFQNVIPPFNVLNVLKHLLAYVAHGDELELDCARVQLADGNLDAETWHAAVSKFLDHYISTHDLQDSTQFSLVGQLNVALEFLANRKLTPEIPPIRSTTARPKPGSRRPTVVDAQIKNEFDYVEFARVTTRVEEGIEPSAEDIEQATRFAAQLNGDANDVTKALVRLIDVRLNAIKAAATTAFDSIKTCLAEGAELIASSHIEPEAILAAFEQASAESSQAVSAFYRTYFPQHQKQEVLRADLLKILAQSAPDAAQSALAWRLAQNLRRRYPAWPWLAPQSLRASFEISAEAASAVLTLYLLDSGANVEVGRTLPVDAITDSSLPRHKRVAGLKERAGGKAISYDYPDRSPMLAALAWLGTHGANVRAEAGKDGGKLFCIRGRCLDAKLLSGQKYRINFRRHCSTVPELAGLTLAPSWIRSTILLRAALVNDGRIAFGQAIGQHSEPVTQGYQQRAGVRLIYDQHIRQFQNAWETAAFVSDEEAAKKLGLDAEAYEARLAHMQKSGLGTFCSGAPAIDPSATNACASARCWDNCHYLVIVANPESIAALQIWGAALKRAQPDWERDRPERWAQTWLPWLALIDVVEQKMTRGRLLHVWNKATEFRKRLESDAFFAPPQPW